MCDHVDDIEDLGMMSELLAGTSRLERDEVSSIVKSRVKSSAGKGDTEETVKKPIADSILPGTQSIYVKTWGCSHNNSDGEYMAGQLATYGYNITTNKQDADLWLLNSCTVKNPAEDFFRNEVTSAQKQGKHLVLAGCVPQGAPKSNYIQGLSVIGVQQIDRVVEVVEETLKGHTVRLFGQKKHKGKKSGGAALSLPKVRKNPLIEIIPINTGCLNQCTYCKTKHARGELGSYPPDDIVKRAVQAFEEGVVELWLTSEDLGAYGHDIGVTLPQLLWKLVEVIPEGCMMRLGMTNPPYILEHLEEMSKILQHPRVYSFLHVPVQSASDSVLMDMKREYCQQDFNHVVDYLKERVPDVTIATDIICGFPTETKQDFEETVSLVEKYKFPSLFINQFFPRPGTPAAKMQRINPQEVKTRTKQLSDLFQSYTTYDHKVGQRQRVLVTEVSTDRQYYVAHNKCYDQVLVPKTDVLLGLMVDVVITSAGKHYMKADIVSTSEEIDIAASHKTKIHEITPKSSLNGTVNTSHQPAKPATSHPWWVQLGIVVAIIAIIIRISLYVFSNT